MNLIRKNPFFLQFDLPVSFLDVIYFAFFVLYLLYVAFIEDNYKYYTLCISPEWYRVVD